jgi:hypothetical protein
MATSLSVSARAGDADQQMMLVGDRLMPVGMRVPDLAESRVSVSRCSVIAGGCAWN